MMYFSLNFITKKPMIKIIIKSMLTSISGVIVVVVNNQVHVEQTMQITMYDFQTM